MTAAAQDGQTAVALRLAKHLAPSPTDAGENVAFSPVSVHAALALAAAGARGATQAQLLAFLGAPSAEALADFVHRVADRVLADRSGAGGPRVLFGGGVWVDDSRGGLADAFCQVATESYKSDAQTVSFTKEPEEAVRMINEWVKKATDNLIGAIINTDDIDAATDIVLANAVYFKGAWWQPFNFCFTAPFHRLDGSIAEAEFMSGRRWLDVACMDGYKVIKLPYKPGAAAPPAPELDEGTRYSMLVFLPDARGGISTMVDVVTASPAFLCGILAGMKATTVSVQLPKFDIDFRWNGLSSDLIRLGLSLPFSPEAAADLRGMFKGDDDDAAGGARRATFLSKIAHRAVVKVDEVGTEAAAVTGLVYCGCSGLPVDLVEFNADHPFTFFIMEERSGVIVFMGHIVDPTRE